MAKRYDVIRERAGDGTLYEVANLAGKIVSVHPMSLRAANELADLYDGDDDANEAQERASAELDG
jgi:hypothetical protein